LVCVLLTGAGASVGLNSVYPHAPPLGKDLLRELQRFSGVWRDLPLELAEGFQGPDGFEGGFPIVRERNDKLTMSLLRGMALYFARFTSTARTKYDFLLAAIERLRPDCHLATLNYDLLLDEAIAHRFAEIRYDGSEPLRSILKLHGAPNCWIDPDFAQGVGTGYSGFHTVARGAPVRFLSSSDTEAAFRQQLSGCPVISMYSKEKHAPICPDVIERYHGKFREVVLSADRLVIIGASYAAHDRHVWEPVEATSAEVRIVDVNQGGFDSLASVRGGRVTRVVASTLRDLLIEPELAFG
jgi:hypothetical protein